MYLEKIDIQNKCLPFIKHTQKNRRYSVQNFYKTLKSPIKIKKWRFDCELNKIAGKNDLWDQL